MKGVLFTEFMEMVETEFSPEVADAIIADSAVASGGCYTAVGTYPAEELVALVDALGARLSRPASELYFTFGRRLLHRLARFHPAIFEEAGSACALLARVEDAIHAETRKLYPDAELPRFYIEERADRRLVMRYESPRAFSDLARGLIVGCGEHFGERVDVGVEPLCEHGRTVRFTIESAA